MRFAFLAAIEGELQAPRQRGELIVLGSASASAGTRLAEASGGGKLPGTREPKAQRTHWARETRTAATGSASKLLRIGQLRMRIHRCHQGGVPLTPLVSVGSGAP